MSDGTMVSTTPLEWRAHVRAVAHARPVTLRESDLGQRILQLRDEIIRSFGRTVPLAACRCDRPGSRDT